MELNTLFNSISTPEGNSKTFNAVIIPEFPKFRIGKDINGFPTLLIDIKEKVKDISIRNLWLKNVKFIPNIECKIKGNDENEFCTLTIIQFTNQEFHLQAYFLKICEPFIKLLDENRTHQQIIYSIKSFIEVLRSLSDFPIKTIQGLWSELFLIDNSSDPKTLLRFWHNHPNDKFDFNSGNEKIEVKSTINFERVHHFTSEQLNPLEECNILIASIFLVLNENGDSLQTLVENISSKVLDNELIFKLNSVVCKTLGNSLRSCLDKKYDRKIANDSLRFYSHHQIKKIFLEYIPKEVTQVKYRSDLTSLKPIHFNTLSEPGLLFKSL